MRDLASQHAWNRHPSSKYNRAALLVALEGEGHGWKDAKLLKTIEQMAAFYREHLKE